MFTFWYSGDGNVVRGNVAESPRFSDLKDSRVSWRVRAVVLVSLALSSDVTVARFCFQRRILYNF